MPAANPRPRRSAARSRPRPRLRRSKARIGHKFGDPDAADDRVHACVRAQARAQSRRELSAPGVSRRPRARADRVGHAVSRLSERRRGRIVEASGRSRAQGELRRCRKIARPGRRHQARPGRRQCERPAAQIRARRHLRSRDRGDLSRRRLQLPPRNSSSATGPSGCASRAGRCAIPRPCCRNGRRARGCRRRSIARSSAPGRITIRNSASSVDLPGLAPAEGVGGSKRAAEKVAASVMIAREGVGGGSNDG